MKVLVLCGGESPERFVSLASGDAVGVWIHEAGHEIVKYDPTFPGKIHRADERIAPESIGLIPPRNLPNNGYDPRTVQGLLDVISEFKPEIIFPILHGGRGEDGSLQALLDWLEIPYAGSDALASGMAINKEVARTLMRAAGVLITEGFVVTLELMRDVAAVTARIKNSFGYPAIIKPLHGGSTVGLTKVNAADHVSAALETVTEFGDVALIEAYFTGREIAATIIAEEAYPLVEIIPKSGFYDYSNKYTSGRSEYVCPAEISVETTRAIQTCAKKAFAALGCKGFARLDFLLNVRQEFVCLEINTLPGMTANSLVPKAARAKGIEPPQMVQIILDCALSKQGFSR